MSLVTYLFSEILILAPILDSFFKRRLCGADSIYCALCDGTTVSLPDWCFFWWKVLPSL